MSTEAKYHHLIPQTYMSAWANSSGTLNVEFKNKPGKIVPRNTENIAGITNYHSITAGMPICTKQDTDKIFNVLAQFVVKYNGTIISDTLKMNDLYDDFDNWDIVRQNGTLVGKKELKNVIKNVKIKDIEENWSKKYENYWSNQVKTIEKNVLNANTNVIPEFDREFIMKFYTALDWRGFCSNKLFEQELVRLNDILPLDEIEIPFEKREFPFLKTAGDEMKHYLLLKFYRQYLDDKGIIYDNAMKNLKYTSFHFLIADGTESFCTSDTPAFWHIRNDEKTVGIMPITPKILLLQGKCIEQEKDYYISKINDSDVKMYNEIIANNATEFVIK